MPFRSMGMPQFGQASMAGAQANKQAVGQIGEGIGTAVKLMAGGGMGAAGDTATDEILAQREEAMQPQDPQQGLNDFLMKSYAAGRR